MVDLVRLQLIKEADQVCRVCNITVVQEQSNTVDVWILIEMIDPRGIERACPSNNPVDLIPFRQEQFHQIGAILPGDPGNECFLQVVSPISDEPSTCFSI